MRYVIIDAGGAVLRQGYSPDATLQAGAGEIAYEIEDSDGTLIDDTVVTIDEDGEYVGIDPEELGKYGRLGRRTD